MKKLSNERKVELLTDLVEAQLEYQKLLAEELDELAVFATVHHWRSSRIDRGIIAREKIKSINDQLNIQ